MPEGNFLHAMNFACVCVYVCVCGGGGGGGGMVLRKGLEKTPITQHLQNQETWMKCKEFNCCHYLLVFEKNTENVNDRINRVA